MSVRDLFSFFPKETCHSCLHFSAWLLRLWRLSFEKSLLFLLKTIFESLRPLLESILRDDTEFWFLSSSRPVIINLFPYLGVFRNEIAFFIYCLLCFCHSDPLFAWSSWFFWFAYFSRHLRKSLLSLFKFDTILFNNL